MANKKPEEMTWDERVQDLYGQITSRPDFQYDPNSDPLWQSAKDQYVHAGRRAMEDTMGQAAALTGGYSSSYAQSAGQQQYDEYMTNLNAKIGEYAQMARANYDADTGKLYDQLNYAQGMAEQDYNRGRDALADQRYEQEWAQQQRAYEDDLAYRQWQQQQSGQDRAYQMVMQMIATGQTPSAELLAQAGVGADYAASMANYYKQQAAGYGGSGGSGGRSYSGGGGSGSGSGAGTGSTISQDDMNSVLTRMKVDRDAGMRYFLSHYSPEEFDNYDDVLAWLTDEYNKWYDEYIKKNTGGGGGGHGGRSGETRDNRFN